MAKNSVFIKLSEDITRYSIFLLIFFLPLFFLPFTADIFDFNKQSLLLLLSFTALFSWMVKVLISGNFSININKTHIAVLIFFFIYLASTIFSKDRSGSFWGWPRLVSESFFTLAGLVVFYFVVSNIFSKKEIFTSVVIFALSCLLAVLTGFLQGIGIFIMPFDFAKNTSFNTLGSAGGLAFFTAVFLPLLLSMAIFLNNKWLKMILGAGIVLSLVFLVFINYYLVWWLVLAGSALFILFGMLKRDIFDLRWLSAAMFFLVLALFFLVLNPQLPLPKMPVEIFLNQRATFDIAVKSIKESPILGSGPGTFVYNFSKYKDASFNQGSFWNIVFNRGSSKALNIAATTGILGAISFLLLIGAVLFYGAKFILLQKHGRQTTAEEKSFNILALGVLAAFMVQTIGYFLYNSSLSLEFLYFFLIAAVVGLSNSERKNFSLDPSSLLNLAATFIFTIVFIFGLGLLILGGQRYVAQVYYFVGESAFAKGDINQAIFGLEKAVSLNPSADVYLTELSQMYLLKIAVANNDNSLSREEKAKQIQLLVQNAVNAAKIATDASPKNVSNWSVRGYVGQNLIGIIDGADVLALNSYDEAIKLDPNSPYYPNQKGLVYMRKSAAAGKDKTAEKEQALIQAKEQFDKAVQLKSDYAAARFQIAIIMREQGKTKEAIETLKEAAKYSPQDVGLAFQTGLIYYQEKDFQNAKAEFERAVVLSPNYSNGLYFLGLTYFELGQRVNALEKFSKLAELNPGNQEVKKIVNNLNAGRKPLEGITEEAPPQAPIEEKPTEEKK
ncbi:MAG: tetratricopeptide repeat protein [Candidatus Staskawiczbacteria bacterium]|nr:tetratricopeptide repeat protein [Candidatus Staskawiczbacteria bacterium]